MLIHNLMAFEQISTILNLQKDNKIHRITKNINQCQYSIKNLLDKISTYKFQKKKKSQLSVAKENRELEG